MLCPRCQSENPPNAAFCDQCGARLEKACPNCGEPNRHGAKFCKNCGQAINESATTSTTPIIGVAAPDTYVPKHLAEKILASRHKLEGERKQVTVLFADIKGSTKLLEALDPEEAQKIIDPVLHIMMDAVHKYEGTVNQVLGDGIMALFGAPLAHEDHALRACYASLAMQDEMRRYRQGVGQSEEAGLHIGIGMNSGEVVVRSIDTDLNIDYSAIGHTTHLAARMQELAGPSLALMSSSTLRQVEGFVQVQHLGPVRAKGVSQPVEAYSLIGATTARTRIQAGASRGLTPLVGRDAEIDIFNKLVKRTSAGRGQIMAMIGEPGIGKSRLVHEFTRHQLPPGWLVLEAASVSYGKATPYFPLIEMLRRYFGIGTGEGSEDIQSRVAIHILELDNTLKDAIPPILSLLGALTDEQTTARDRDWLTKMPEISDIIRHFNSMDPQQRRRHTLDSLKRICIRESRRQDLLLVFEDLHWIDHETQAFLDLLVDSLPMTRLFLLVNYRPEYNHLWSEKSYYTQLRVDPLQTSSAEELLSKLLGNNPDLTALKHLLVKRTDGNPFFAEESVRSLVEASVLTGERGAYRPGLKIDDLVIPNTVQNVVADRIDRLPAEEKHLLQTAAVIGVIVPFDLLQAVSELSDDQLFQYLAHLKSAEFIYESNLFPTLEYTFKHALTNEVAYGALLHDRRVALHARIVSALEATTGTQVHDHVEKLAYHAFYGEHWEKAVKYLKEAGTKAMIRSANANAVLLFDRALAALQKWPDSRDKLVHAIDVRLELRNALFLLGEFGRIEKNLKDAQAAAEKLQDRERLRRVWNAQLSLFSLNGEPEQVIEFGERALNPDMSCADRGLDGVTYYYMGIAHHMMGNYRRAMDVLRRAIAIVDVGDLRYQRFGTSNIISVSCRNWLVHSLALTGSFRDGILTAQEGISIAEEIKHPYSLAYITCSLGFLYLVKGDLKQALEVFERCERCCEESNIRVLVPQTSAYLGFAHALQGNANEALSLLDRGDVQSISIGRTSGQSLRVSWHGESCLLSGRLQDALRIASRALELSVKHRERGHGAWAMKLMGDITALTDEAGFAKAEDFYNQGMSVAVELGMRPLEAHCHFGLGKLYLRAAQSKAAHRELSKAATLYSDMDMRFWLAKAETALAEAR